MEMKITDEGERRIHWMWENNGTMLNINQSAPCLPDYNGKSWEEIFDELEKILVSTAKINL